MGSGRTAAGTDNSRNHRTSTDHGGAHASDDYGCANDNVCANDDNGCANDNNGCANDDNGCTYGGLHLCIIADDDHGSTNDYYGRTCSGHQLRPPTNNLVGKCQAAIKPAVRLSEHQPRCTQLYRLITNFVALW